MPELAVAESEIATAKTGMPLLQAMVRSSLLASLKSEKQLYLETADRWTPL